MSSDLEALFAAIRDRDQGKIEVLLAADSSLLSRRNAMGISPLSWAAYLEQTSILELLRSLRGTPDFHEACIVGDESTVREALRGGQDVNAPAPDGFTPLGLAVFFRQPEVMRLLLDSGADVNARANNAQQVGPVHAAVARGDLASLEVLLNRGADPDAPQAKGIRALHVAAANGNAAAVDLLLRFGARPQLASDDGSKPEALARRSGHAALADRLHGMT